MRLQSERDVEDFVYDPLLHITAIYATRKLYILLAYISFTLKHVKAT